MWVLRNTSAFSFQNGRKEMGTGKLRFDLAVLLILLEYLEPPDAGATIIKLYCELASYLHLFASVRFHCMFF